MKVLIEIDEEYYEDIHKTTDMDLPDMGWYQPMRRAIKNGTPLPKNHGRWIRHTRVEDVYDIAGVKTWGIKHQCDQCTFTTIAIEGFGYYDFCPNCGADMRKAERDEVKTCENCKHYKHFGKEFPCIDCMMDCKDRFEEREDKE